MGPPWYERLRSEMEFQMKQPSAAMTIGVGAWATAARNKIETHLPLVCRAGQITSECYRVWVDSLPWVALLPNSQSVELPPVTVVIKMLVGCCLLEY